jgi:mono/diheme cytochrome c family protein
LSPPTDLRSASRARALRLSRSFFAGTALLLTTTVGCWEQWSDTWFPQMKRQKAVQAFEEVIYAGHVENLSPPEGTVPAGTTIPPEMDPNDVAAQDALQNPHPMSLASLENGRTLFNRYCSTCHGPGGLGDGPVSTMSKQRGPFVGVLAIAGPASIAKIRTDGHIYSTIRYGRRRMPSYHRIPSDDRWDIVNFVRYLNDPTRFAQAPTGGGTAK